MAMDHNLEVRTGDQQNRPPRRATPRWPKEIENVIGLDAAEAPVISAKMGANIQEVLEAIVQHIPAPEGDQQAPLQALIFDACTTTTRG